MPEEKIEIELSEEMEKEFELMAERKLEKYEENIVSKDKGPPKE